MNKTHVAGADVNKNQQKHIYLPWTSLKLIMPKHSFTELFRTGQIGPVDINTVKNTISRLGL